MPKMLANRGNNAAGAITAVHIRCNAAGKIKREKRDGRETIVIPSFAAKAGTVLNGILYPRDELEKSIAGLNRTPAPLGHPTINNKFVPALDPEALARNHIFAWNENPRWDGDRIALDVVIDEARAKESEGGKSVLNAIDKQEPICTSTGLLCNLEEVSDRAHKAVARNIEWDHVAILMDEAPAISPEEGVGIFVNSASADVPEITVINSALDEADEQMDWEVESVARALERRSRAGMLDRMKAAILEALGVPPVTENEEQPMTISKEQFDALAAKVDGLAASVNQIPDTVSASVTNALKPVLDAQKAAADKVKADEDAEASGLIEKVVKANVLDEATAKATPLATLRVLAKGAEPKKAAPLNAAFRQPVKAGAFSLPEGD